MCYFFFYRVLRKLFFFQLFLTRFKEKIGSENFPVSFVVDEILKVSLKFGNHNFSTSGPILKQRTLIKPSKKSEKLLFLLFPRKIVLWEIGFQTSVIFAEQFN